ncbi:MAG: DNA polymerase III subunit alpha [Elusimicrobiota bacterium]
MSLKKQSRFVHLHNHTEYSFLDGACRILDDKGNPAALLKTMEGFGLPALAITDHGNMCGAIEFYNGCFKSGIKPIIGLEAYFAEKSHKNKIHGEKNYHLTLLVKDETGYKNLTKLSSISYLDGFYYKPRIDRELLQKYSEGLVVLSGCLHGEIATLLLEKKYESAKKSVDFFKQVFKDDFYIELMENGMPEQKLANEKLIALAKEMSIPVVATNDCHYLKKEDAQAHEILICIGTATTLADPKHLKFATDEFYYKSPEEMINSFKDVPDAIKNTLAISEKCNLILDFDKLYLPDYKVPENFTHDFYLKKLCKDGLKKRYNLTDESSDDLPRCETGHHINKADKLISEIENRLEHELKTISNAGYSSYFLIVWDFIQYAKSNHIPVGPGRGSGAGSIVSYLLGITEVDPLKYGLLFERFLNPSRLSMPDLDIDFADDGRDKVIDYVRNKYGANRVSHIITFGSMLARGVMRDVGRVLSIPLDEVNKLTTLIPKQLGITLSQSISIVPELKVLYEKDEKIKKLIDVALKLEGLKRQPGVHAAGIVIGKDEITNYVPLAVGKDGIATTQYEGKFLEKMGLLKMDFLGLRTLTVIRDTVELVKSRHKIKIEIKNIPLDDKKTFQLLSNAKVAGVFQVEKSGMRDLLKKLKPKSISDITAIISLYRPGPMGSGMLDEFIDRYHGKTKFKYENSVMEKILSETYGVIVYQEQVMKIATGLAGLTLFEADIFRSAMGKKDSEVIEKYREIFIDGAKKNGLTKAVAEKIFNNIKSFGEYGFNKSHATAYGFLTYRTAYLKANYPLEFFTALLSSEIGHIKIGKEDENKVIEYIDDAKEFAIEILPPDINKSFSKFTIEDKSIRFGLVAIKNVGDGAIESIAIERDKNGKFKSIDNFITRIDFHCVNKKVLESLCKAGALDSILPKKGIMPTRDTFCENIVQIIANAPSNHQKKDSANQSLLFDVSMLQKSRKNECCFYEIPEEKHWHEHQLLAFEKEVLGFYLSGHPLAKYSNEMKIYVEKDISQINQTPTSFETVRVAGIIVSLRRLISKKKEQYARFKLEDLDGEIDVLVFPRLFDSLNGDILKMDEMVVVTGRLNTDNEPPEIIADEIVTFNQARKKLVRFISINISEIALEKQVLEKLKDFLKLHIGIARVEFVVIDHTGKNSTKILTDFEVEPNDMVISGIEKLLGKGVVTFSGIAR